MDWMTIFEVQGHTIITAEFTQKVIVFTTASRQKPEYPQKSRDMSRGKHQVHRTNGSTKMPGNALIKMFPIELSQFTHEITQSFKQNPNSSKIIHKIFRPENYQINASLTTRPINRPSFKTAAF
jgi:hypothetical protein